MKLNEADFEVKSYLTLFPLGDVHYGCRDCDVPIFEAHLGMIKDTKDAAVILTGDLINCGTRFSIGAGNYDDSVNPEKQYETMLDYLKPIKKKIIGCHQGNHEERIRELTSFDISKMLSKELGVPYLQYGALHKIKVNDVNYHIYSVHGTSGAPTLVGKINACLAMQSRADADIYLMGHTHGLDYTPLRYYKINNKNSTIECHVRHFILTGSFITWDGSYGEKKNYSIAPIGIPKIKLFGELSRGAKKIEVKFTDR